MPEKDDSALETHDTVVGVCYSHVATWFHINGLDLQALPPF